MNFIIDPANGTHYELFSTNGKNLLKKYVKYIQSGGMLTIWDKEEIVKDIKTFIEVKDKDGKIIGKKDMIHIMDLLYHLHNKYENKNYKEWMRYAMNLIMYKFKDSGIVDKIVLENETINYKIFKNACAEKGTCSEQIDKIPDVKIDKSIYKNDTVKLLLYFKDNKKIKSELLKEYFTTKYNEYKNLLNKKIAKEEENRKASVKAKKALEEKKERERAKKKGLSIIVEGSETDMTESSSDPVPSLSTATESSE